jgi:hypothetical protein
MMSSDSESIVPATRSRWLRRLLYAAGTIALLVLAVWVAVPPIARAQLETRLTEALGRTTTVESVAFDLYALRLVVRNLVIADKTAQRPLFALDELVANVSAASLWHRAPVFDAVKLTRPRTARAHARQLQRQDLVDPHWPRGHLGAAAILVPQHRDRGRRDHSGRSPRRPPA